MPAFFVVEHHVRAISRGIAAFGRRRTEDRAECVLGIRQEAVDQAEAAFHGGSVVALCLPDQGR